MNTHDCVTITPEMAKEFLTHNTRNRKVKSGRVAKYAAEIASGRWQINPEGISFYENGDLRDGQNRLYAIIKANTPAVMNITYGVPNDSVICDRGAGRSVVDIFYMAGQDKVANQITVGTINMLFKLAKQSTRFVPREQDELEFAVDHEDDIIAATNAVASGGGGDGICKKASVAAACFCAIKCGVDLKVITRFCSVANTGHQSDPSEDAAITFRNQLLKDYRKGTSGAVAQTEIFNIACQAIKDFQRCVPRRRRYSVIPDAPFFKRTKTNVMDLYI